ncbi:MAG: 2-amino-4-hydroxy-6-hydroxymethyldihydropteridine diphosphokinase [Pseudomonadota bacterium]
MDDRTPTQAFLGLGGNVGDVRAAMGWAIEQLGLLPSTRVVCVSPLYKTPPWGITTQNWFLNAVVEIDTSLSPHDLLRSVIEIEKQAGRVRDMRWGPRTLDIDVLLYDQISIRTKDLTIPHPRMVERAFVMVPLVDIAPDVMVAGRAAREIANDVDREELRVLATDWVTTKVVST